MTLPNYQKDIIKWLTGVVCTVAGLAAGGHYLLPEIDSAREPASVAPTRNKMEILKGNAQERALPEGKGGGALRIVIRSMLPAENQLVGHPIALEALVQARHAMLGLKFSWQLPRDVTVTSGDVSGVLGDLSENETKTLSITVQTTAQENRQIHLNVFREEGGENVGDVAQFNTAPDLKTATASKDLKAEATGPQPGAQLIQ